MQSLALDISIFALGCGFGFVLFNSFDSNAFPWMKTFSKKPAKENTSNSSDGIVEFVSPNKFKCRTCLKLNTICYRKKSCGLNLLRKVTTILETAQKSVDICVCLITLPKITAILANLSNNGVQVRVICDKNQMVHGTTGGDAMDVIRSSKIQFINATNERQMHHKFAVVDSKIVIVGSMNWTVSGFFVNYENIEITSDTGDVSAFKTEFQELWELLSR